MLLYQSHGISEQISCFFFFFFQLNRFLFFVQSILVNYQQRKKMEVQPFQQETVMSFIMLLHCR